jgi:hypothetical protein
MKRILIADNIYRALSADAKRRNLTPEEVVEVLLKREYKIK